MEIKRYRDAIAENPDDPNNYFILAFYYVKERPYIAINLWSKVIELQPENAEAFFCIGGTLRSLDKLKQARMFLQKSVELEPNKARMSLLHEVELEIFSQGLEG